MYNDRLIKAIVFHDRLIKAIVWKCWRISFFANAGTNPHSATAAICCGTNSCRKAKWLYACTRTSIHCDSSDGTNDLV